MACGAWSSLKMKTMLGFAGVFPWQGATMLSRKRQIEAETPEEAFLMNGFMINLVAMHILTTMQMDEVWKSGLPPILVSAVKTIKETVLMQLLRINQKKIINKFIPCLNSFYTTAILT